MIGYTLFTLLIIFSIVLGYNHVYQTTKQSRQMLMMFPDPETGKVGMLAKYQKTWWDKLMEWFPQAIVAFIFGFLFCAVLFLPH